MLKMKNIVIIYSIYLFIYFCKKKKLIFSLLNLHTTTVKNIKRPKRSSPYDLCTILQINRSVNTDQNVRCFSNDNLLTTEQTFISTQTTDVRNLQAYLTVTAIKITMLIYIQAPLLIFHAIIMSPYVMYDIIHNMMNDIITVCGFRLRLRLRSYCWR